MNYWYYQIQKYTLVEIYGGYSMKKWLLITAFVLFLFGCSSDNEAESHEDEHQSDEAHGEHEGHDEHDDHDVAGLDVDFPLPEQASVGETVELKAIVTSNGEPIEDADEVDFEYWHTDDEENSTHILGEHTENGEYIAEVTFTEPGIYEIYAHTTAIGLHTMPKESI